MCKHCKWSYCTWVAANMHRCKYNNMMHENNTFCEHFKCIFERYSRKLKKYVCVQPQGVCTAFVVNDFELMHPDTYYLSKFERTKYYKPSHHRRYA